MSAADALRVFADGAPVLIGDPELAGGMTALGISGPHADRRGLAPLAPYLSPERA